MTEDEAKTKTCHKTLVPVASADGSAPWFLPQACIGSACMAWRNDAVFVSQVNDKGATVQLEGRSYTSGHCGLAGKP